MTSVSIATDSDRERWLDFLKRNAVSHHAYAWHWRQILPEVFSHPTHYLIAVRSPETGVGADSPPPSESLSKGQVVGILPIAEMKSMLFGHALISLPYLNAGGILAEDAEAGTALLEAAVELGAQLKVSYLELRQREPVTYLAAKLIERSHKVAMSLPLPGNAEELFSSFAPKLRSQIRRPTKSGIYAEVSRGLSSQRGVSAFFSVFSEHMRDLGTPSYPRSLFHSVLSHFGDDSKVVTVWSNDRPVAAGITLSQGPGVEIPWASSLKKYNKLSPNMLLYWEAIKSSCDDSHSFFDFGRSSPKTGTYRFKEQWNPAPVPLYWYYNIYRGEVPDVNPSNPKYTMMVACWKRLPLPVANLIGPWLTRSLP